MKIPWRRTRCRAAVLASVFVVVGVAHAQEQRATVEGVVRDSQGVIVPGVLVSARSPVGMTFETVSDGSGIYRYASLPPGRYELIVRSPGFVTARVVDIDLTLGIRLNVDVALQPAGPTERVEVVSESPRIAITQAARGTSLRDEAIEKMPRGRDFTSLAVQAPATNDERKLGGVSIDGASGAENRVVIDGVETTDTWIGTPGQFLVTDFLEELQVKSSGYSAEYGGSTGGVLNAITRSGSNVWHGEGLFYWSGDALDARSRPTLQLVPDDSNRAEYVVYPEDAYRQLEPGFTLGGPIFRDRLWLFAGYVPSLRPLDRTVTFRADGTTRTFHQDLRRHHAAMNVTAQISSRWRARAAFSTGRQTQYGRLPEPAGTGNPAADYAIADILPNYSVAASADFIPATWAILSMRTGYFSKNLYNTGVYQGDRYSYVRSSMGLAGVPPEYQRSGGFVNVPSNISRDKGRGTHLGLQFDGSASFIAAGRHQLKAGVQFDQVGIDLLVGNTGNAISVFWDLSLAGRRGRYGYYMLNSNDVLPNRGFVTQGDATVSNIGVFLQDAWTIGERLTLHAGLRTENEHVPSLSSDPRIPRTAITFGFADKLAPRFGVAWDVTGDGKTKLYGSWGMFYDITKLQLSFGFGGVKNITYAYTLETGDLGTIVDNPDCPPACPGSLIRDGVTVPPLNDPDNNRIDPDLRQMRVQETVMGVEREITPKLSLSARYIHKQLDRAIEDLGIQNPQQPETVVVIGNPGFGGAGVFFPGGGAMSRPVPRAARDYDAFEVGVDKRLSNRWSARVFYTLSRLHGNYSGLAHSDEDGRVAPNSGVSFDYPLRSFDEQGEPVYGVLATDRPHQVKAHVLADFPLGTSVGARWIGASGIPRTREASYAPGVPVMYRRRNSDGRMPFLSQLDLYVQQVMQLGGRFRLTVSANLINALNQDTAANYFPSELFTGQFITVDETQFYNGVDTQALIAEQQLVRDARFLMTSGYQAPRTVRVGIKLGF